MSGAAACLKVLNSMSCLIDPSTAGSVLDSFILRIVLEDVELCGPPYRFFDTVCSGFVCRVVFKLVGFDVLSGIVYPSISRNTS